MRSLEPLVDFVGRIREATIFRRARAVEPYPGIGHPVAIARLPIQIPDVFALDARIANEPHRKNQEGQTSLDVVTKVGSGENDVRWRARRRPAVKSSPGGV
jgi:hypothetical protein